MGLPVAASVAPAVIALVGTLVGALIGAITNAALARGKRRDEGRATARLVEDELQTAVDVLDEWLATYPGEPPERSRQTLDGSAWNEGRAVLAYSLRRADWDIVRQGYGEIHRLRHSLEEGGRRFSKKELNDAREEVVAARETLHLEGIGARAAARLRARSVARAGKLVRAVIWWRRPAERRRAD